MRRLKTKLNFSHQSIAWTVQLWILESLQLFLKSLPKKFFGLLEKSSLEIFELIQIEISCLFWRELFIWTQFMRRQVL